MHRTARRKAVRYSIWLGIYSVRMPKNPCSYNIHQRAFAHSGSCSRTTFWLVLSHTMPLCGYCGAAGAKLASRNSSFCSKEHASAKENALARSLRSRPQGWNKPKMFSREGRRRALVVWVTGGEAEATTRQPTLTVLRSALRRSRMESSKAYGYEKKNDS